MSLWSTPEPHGCLSGMVSPDQVLLALSIAVQFEGPVSHECIVVNENQALSVLRCLFLGELVLRIAQHRLQFPTDPVSSAVRGIASHLSRAVCLAQRWLMGILIVE